MGRFSRDKGARGEREFIRAVARLTGGKVRLSRNLSQPRDGGDDCLGHDHWSIEIKRRSQWPGDAEIALWWQSAVANARRFGKQPVLAWRKDHQDWRVMLHLQQGFALDDVAGCLTLSAALFCHYLVHPDGFGLEVTHDATATDDVHTERPRAAL